MSITASIRIALLLVAACTQVGRVEAGDPLDPCAMLSPADAEAALGGPAAKDRRGSVKERRTSVFASCTHFAAKDPLRFVAYTVTRWKEPKQAETARTALPKGYEKRGTKLTESSGLGDAAFWDGSTLFVFRGDLQITVSASNAVARDADARLARARGVATVLLAKL